MIKFIKNYPLTSMALTILIFVELIYLKDIFTDKNRIFSLSIDPTINGLNILLESFKLPILIFLGSITPIWFITTIDDKLRNKNTINIDMTKKQKKLIKQIQKRKIKDFETLIIKYLKPSIKKIEIKYTIGNTNFEPNDKVYVFDDPRETILKIKSMIKLMTFLINNNAIELISKYEKIYENKSSLNSFYIFTKTPKEKNYFWDNYLNNILYKNFGISKFDKEIRPIENRLKYYLK